MACQTRPPTGEKAPPTFVAPTFVPTETAQTQRFIQSQLQAIAADLKGLHAAVAAAPATQALEATGGTVQAREGDTIRVTPPAAGVVVLLPTARAANKGQEVAILVEGSDGPVTVRAVDSLVQNEAEVVLTGLGLRLFRSDGGNGQANGGWWIVGQSSADSGNRLMAISAGTNLASTGTVVFSNSNALTFGMNTSGVVTASWALGFQIPGATTSVTSLQFSDNNNMSWTGNSNGVVIGRPFVIASVVGQTFVALSRLAFSASNGVSFGISTSNNNAATITASVSSLVFSNSNGLTWGTNGSTVTGSFSTLSYSNANNVTFGIAGSTLTASVTVASTADSIRVSAGTTNVLGSQLSFNNGSGVSFGLNGSTITASVATSLTAINLSAGTTSNNLSAFTLSNANNVSFGLNGSVVTASATVASTQASINLSAGTTSNLASAFTFANSNSISFGLNAGTITASVSYPTQTAFVLSNSNGISFGTAGSTVTASYTVPTLTSLSFSNANNVTFGIAGSTLTASASVASTADSIRISAGTTNVLGSAFSFSGGVSAHNTTAPSNVQFGLNGSSISAIAPINWSAGTTSFNHTIISFSNSNNVSWGVQTQAGSIPFITASASFPAATSLSFSNANNVTFGIAGSTLTASVTVASTQGSLRVSAGTTNNLLSNLSFGGTGNVGFGLNGSSITATAGPVLFFEGVGPVLTASRIDFRALGNATASVIDFGGGVARVQYSVGAGAGIALADVYGQTRTNGTVVASIGVNSTLTSLFSANSRSNNVIFGLSGSTLTAQAHIAVDDNTGANGSVATRINFLSSNGISFGAVSQSDTAGARQINFTASMSRATCAYVQAFSNRSVVAVGTQSSSGCLWPMKDWRQGDITLDFMDLRVSGASVATGAAGSGAWSMTVRGGLYTLANSSQISLLNSFSYTTGSTTYASSASSNATQRNALFAGARWLVVSSSQWSAQPVLMSDVEYWMLLAYTTGGGGSCPIASTCIEQALQQQGQGFVGVNCGDSAGQATSRSAMFAPFWGFIPVATIPPVINSNSLLPAITLQGYKQYAQFRDGIYSAGG